MTSLRDFIAARLDEDEAVALAAAKDAAGYSHGYPNDPISEWRINDEGDLYADHIFLAGGAYGGGIDEKFSAHLVRHDPARVLREVAAKRAILALNLPPVSCDDDHPQYDTYHPGGHGPHPVYIALAQAHPDHPDFDPNWSTT